MSVDPDTRARDRLAVLLGLRIGGAALIAVGIYVWLGGDVEGGGGFGTVALVAGAIVAFALPALLIRRWRTPR